jgi:cation diffusion facilitator CzcD-associated flavoprotein CzcO
MTHVRVAIVGAGFGGIGTAIRLKQQGIEDFVIFERAPAIGGTWRDNSYPGCTCDVPSNLYCFSFAPNPTWTRSFSPQAEIWDYLERCVTRYGLTPHLRLAHEVIGAQWLADQHRWQIDTNQGSYTADILVAAAGPLSEPAFPKLPGLESFQGSSFHSARWDHERDLTGQRVAVIGTGASAVQFIPQIADKVAQLTVFQRTAAWVLPRRDRALSRAEHRLYRCAPVAQRVTRNSIYWSREAFAMGFLHPRVMRLVEGLARKNLEKQVPDAELRAKLMPEFTLGCKRVLLSSEYLPALGKPNVDVVTEKIADVRPQGISTVDGRVYPADTLIFGTGFHVTETPIAERIRGRDGRSLAEVWQGSPKAYLGVTVAGFPNLFLLLGPNTGLGHTSVVVMIECQLQYLLSALRFLDWSGATAVEPRADAQAAFVAEMDRRMAPTVWLAGGCRSWYLDRTGRNSTIWPSFTFMYRHRLRRFDPGPYVVTKDRREAEQAGCPHARPGAPVGTGDGARGARTGSVVRPALGRRMGRKAEK